jgi:hypothetical protein
MDGSGCRYRDLETPERMRRIRSKLEYGNSTSCPFQLEQNESVRSSGIDHGDKMNRLTDMELLARIDIARSAIAEMETNLVNLNVDLGSYIRELRQRESECIPMDSYRRS